MIEKWKHASMLRCLLVECNDVNSGLVLKCVDIYSTYLIKYLFTFFGAEIILVGVAFKREAENSPCALK